MLRFDVLLLIGVLAGGLLAPPPAGAGGEAGAAALTPKAVAPVMMHHFGVMYPNQVAVHRFKFRNDGGAPLEVLEETGSCKCLSVTPSKRLVPPGEEAEVIVKWRAGEKTGEPFRQLVQVTTNDPKKPVIEFVVTGDVGGHINLAPTRVAWANARRGEAKTAKVRVYSTFWDSLRISGLESDPPGLRLAVEDVPPAKRINRLAKSSKQLVVTAPADLCESSFTALVTFSLSQAAPSPPGAEPSAADKKDFGYENVRIQVPVALTIGEPLSVIGGGFDAELQKAQLGVQRPGQKLVRRYMLKVRDDLKTLNLVSARAEPDVIGVALSPYKPAAGLYRLELRLPPDALDRAYVGSAAGSLELEFDHPRIPRLSWKLEVSPSN